MALFSQGEFPMPQLSRMSLADLVAYYGATTQEQRIGHAWYCYREHLIALIQYHYRLKPVELKYTWRPVRRGLVVRPMMNAHWMAA